MPISRWATIRVLLISSLIWITLVSFLAHDEIAYSWRYYASNEAVVVEHRARLEKYENEKRQEPIRQGEQLAAAKKRYYELLTADAPVDEVRIAKETVQYLQDLYSTPVIRFEAPSLRKPNIVHVIGVAVSPPLVLLLLGWWVFVAHDSSIKKQARIAGSLTLLWVLGTLLVFWIFEPTRIFDGEELTALMLKVAFLVPVLGILGYWLIRKSLRA